MRWMLPLFALGVYEVTFEDYDRFVQATGHRRPTDRGWGRGGRPVIDVSWEDAEAYVAWLSRETGESYRLPSESEWEYAARAGTTTRYSWGQDIGRNRAHCPGCGSRWDDYRTAPAGSFAANGWGLHDMHGNVHEWVADCWHENYARAPRDGTAWTSGGNCGRRVLRGGSWFYFPVFLRSAHRRNPRCRRARRQPRLSCVEDARLTLASLSLHLLGGGWGAPPPSDRIGGVAGWNGAWRASSRSGAGIDVALRAVAGAGGGAGCSCRSC